MKQFLDPRKPFGTGIGGSYYVYPVHNKHLKPCLLKGRALQLFLTENNLCDITALIPLWVSCHGWIRGLGGLCDNDEDGGDFNWLESVAFRENLESKPRQKLPEQIIKGFLNNQIKLRLIVLQYLSPNIPESFQHLQVMATQNVDDPYNNDYDLISGYDTYVRLWHNYQAKWNQQQRISMSYAKPIANHLAFPPKAIRWQSTLDGRDYGMREKWDRLLILKDFESTLFPRRHHRIEDMDIFDLPLSMEVTEEQTERFLEMDQMLKFFILPSEPFPEPVNTCLDQDIVQQNLHPDIPRLLANLDLQKDAIDNLIARFKASDISIEHIIHTLFNIKKQDQDLLLNQIILFANSHVQAVATLEPAAKQVVNNFLVDIVDLFSNLKIRQIQPPAEQPWLHPHPSINQLETIIQNKIHMDLKTIDSLRQMGCVDINRFQTSSIVHQLTRVYDLYILNVGIMVDQFHRNAEILSDIAAKIARRRIGSNEEHPSLLKYILVRQPGRGNLIQLQNQCPLIPRGTSGFCITSPPSNGKRKSELEDSMTSAHKYPASDLDDSMSGANSRPATFDLLDTTVETDNSRIEQK